jgi:hypothetical protein
MSTVSEQRRSRARRQAIDTPSGKRERAEQDAAREGAQAGARRRAREQALDVVGIAADLERERLSDPKIDELLADARETLADAENLARHRGQWTPRDGARMAMSDLVGVAQYAVAATRRRLTAQIARQARPSEEDYQDLYCELVERALLKGRESEPGADHENLPRWDALEPRADRETERRIASLWMRGDADAMDAAERAARKAVTDPSAARGAWRAYLTAHARTWARKRHEEAMAQREIRADAHSLMSERVGDAAAEAAERAAELASVLSLSPRAERAVAECLDGLTDRERSLLDGRTPAAIRQSRKRGMADLLEALPTPEALLDALDLAAAEDAGREAMPADARAELEQDRIVALIEAQPVKNPAKHRIPGITPTLRDRIHERDHAPIVVRRAARTAKALPTIGR